MVKDSSTEYQYSSSYNGDWFADHNEYPLCFKGKPLQMTINNCHIDRISLDKPACFFMFEKFRVKFCASASCMRIAKLPGMDKSTIF